MCCQSTYSCAESDIFSGFLYSLSYARHCNFLPDSIFFTNIGIVLALFYKDWNSFGVVENYIVSPLLFLGGCFFSLEYVPEKFHILFYINPFFHFVNSLRYTFSGYYDLLPIYSFFHLLNFVSRLYNSLFHDI
jgi:ABC-2 type transport system permease protein